jgi:3-oxoacyl-[acyl-carrier-protein] synthase II
MERRRVVVTGMGIVSPLGNDIDEFYANLINGKSGIKSLSSDFDRFTTRIGGTAELPPISGKKTRHWDRFMHFGYYASEKAVAQAGLMRNESWTKRAGAFIGTGIGGIRTIEKNHKTLLQSKSRRISPYFAPMIIANMASAVVSMEMGLQGPCFAPVSACATGNNAIGEAFWAIQSGRVDTMLAGGAEASITPLTIAGFCSLGAMSTRNDTPTEACSPFDKSRDGFVIGEGAGIIVLESMETALERGANVLAEISGYGNTSDAYHFTSPHPEGKGAYRAMVEAVEMAGWRKEEIDYINAHGTGTPLGDKVEAMAIDKLLKHSSEKALISSTKSATGHLFGAAGGIEAIAVIQSMNKGVVPPTLNLHASDPEFDLDFVPLVAREKRIRRALSNAFGFGGHNSVLAFSEFK